jgi:hypothetical protein
MYGILSFCFGIAVYLFGVLLVFPRYFLGLNRLLEPVSAWLVWYSGIPIVLGVGLAFVDLVFFLNHKRPNRPVRFERPASPLMTVALTAYNDEESIGRAVADFASHPLVKRVVLVSNNSSDATLRGPRLPARSPTTRTRRVTGGASTAVSWKLRASTIRSSSRSARAT